MMSFLIFFFFSFALSFHIDTAWVRTYNGPGNGSDYASSLAVDSNGNVYVTGWSYGTREDYLTIKYNPDGRRIWSRRYNGLANGSDFAYGIAVDNLGNVYVTGGSYSSTSYDYVTIKYDPNGNRLWVRRYNGPSNGIDIAYDIAVDNFGNVYVTGGSYGSTSYDCVTIKYDSNGNQLWVRRYNGPESDDDIAYSICVDNLGNVYIAGESFGILYDYVTIKYDSNGNELWVRRYNGLGNLDDYACAVEVDDFGNVYVTGFSYGLGSSYDYATIKYDKNGNELWVRRYNGLGDSTDMAYDLSIDNLGNVYVTGTSYGLNTFYDFATIKYDSDGNELWIARYNGVGNFDDYGCRVVVDNSGNIYVTGACFGIGTYWDYATIKYVENQVKIGEKNSREKNSSLKDLRKKKIYDITGKSIKENKIKKGVYFDLTQKEKIIIIK